MQHRTNHPLLRGTTLLIGAQLADGTGRPLRPADVLLRDTRITAVETPGTIPKTHHTRDLTGAVLAPGFIDVHSHADNAPLLDHEDTTKILQGVTTEVVGNCGFSLAPHSPTQGDTLATFLQRLFPPLEFTWTGFHDLFARTDATGYVTNYCPLVGHGTLRIAASGMTDHPADDTTTRIMRNALEEGMTVGAFGLSSGLIYPPAAFSTTEELLQLTPVLGGDGLYTTHMRDEGEHLLDSIREAFRIGRIAGRTHLSHLKASGPQNWETMSPALNLINQARHDGQPISQNVYPYTASSTMLTTLLPAELLAGDTEPLITRLTSSTGRNELAHALADQVRWDDILIATTTSHQHEGRTLAEIAEAGGADPVDVLIEILVNENLRVAMVHFSMHEADLELALRDAHTTIGSNGLPPGIGGSRIPASSAPSRACLGATAANAAPSVSPRLSNA